MTDDAGDTREERPLTDQERADLYREQLKRLHVIDLVRDMMVTLVTVGYEKLGLTEQTRELRDLRDARVAIESLRRLIEVVEGEGDPEAASLRSTLAQMQLNFARASAEPRPSTAPEPAERRAEPAPEPSVQEHAPAADAGAASGVESPTEKRPSKGKTQAPVEGKSQPRKAAAARKSTAKPTGARKSTAKGAGDKDAGDKGDTTQRPGRRRKDT